MRRPPSHPRLADVLLAAALVAVVIALPACRGRAQRTVSTRPQPMTASPGLRGSAAGIELWCWVVSDRMVEIRPEGAPAPAEGAEKPKDTPNEEATPTKPPKRPPKPPPIVYTFDDGRADLEDVLGPYTGRPVPLPQEVLDRWRASGLRAIAVPRQDLEMLEQRLRLTGPVNRQWLGQVTMWSDIAQGAWREERSTVKIEDQDVQLPPGRLRLSLRCWSVPPQAGTESESGALRLEIVPELEPYRSDQERLLVTAGLAAPKDGGLAPFDRLRLAATLTTDEAIVIVPERTSASWTDAKPIGGSPLTSLPPPMPDNASLGEAMLSRPATETRARARAVLVLIPTPGERFELLGP
jgi:hypothetical protein